VVYCISGIVALISFVCYVLDVDQGVKIKKK
jgi:hypothetical protein